MLINIRKQKNTASNAKGKTNEEGDSENDQHDQSEEESDSEMEGHGAEKEHDLDSDLGVGKVVDRNKKKSRSKLNAIELHKERMQVIEEKRQSKKMDRQFEIMDTLTRHEHDTEKRERKAQIERDDAEAKELACQVNIGVVNKPIIIGRFKYKMRKTDFQLESELAPSLRQLKAQGTDDLMRERFDDIFRRNLVEMDAPTVSEKKRQIKRAYKFRDRKGGLNKTVSEKMKKSNEIQKKKNDEKSSNKWLKNDMILI